MRTKRFRRWLAGLCVVAAAGIGVLAGIEWAVNDAGWLSSVTGSHVSSAK
jgi:hypothetical protein